MAVSDKRELNMGLNSSHGSFELVVSPIVLGLGGWWIDSKLGTGPWFLIGLAVFGVVGAVTKLYLSYTAKMADVTEQARLARDARAAEQADARRAAAMERDALTLRLEAEAAEAEAQLRDRSRLDRDRLDRMTVERAS
ncbi:MAG: AtpZ/AtpI family protein [Acidimicrobiales bacterium]